MTNTGFGDLGNVPQPEPGFGPSELARQVRVLRRWVIGLAVLVTFVAGGLLGGAAMWWHKARQPAAVLGLARAVQVYAAPADRRAFRDALAAGRRAARPQVREVQDARSALAEALAEPSPSAEAIRAALGRLRQADGALRDRLEAQAADALAGFPLDRRRAIAEAITPRGRRANAAED